MGIDFKSPTTPGPKRDRATIKLLAYYVKQIAEAEGVDEKKRLEYVPEYVLGTLRNKWALAAWEDNEVEAHQRFEHERDVAAYEKEKAEVCAELGVDEEAFRFLTQLVFSAVGGRQVLPVWPQVLLDGQPPSQHKVTSMHIILLTQWDDGRLLAKSNLVHSELATVAGGIADGEGLSNAVAAAHILKTMKGWIEDVTERGTDAWHREGDDHGGEAPYDMLMGMLRYIITANQYARDGKQVDLAKFAAETGMRLDTLQQLRVVPPLDRRFVDNMDSWMRLVQAMLKPPMTPEVKKVLEQRRAQRAALQQPQAPVAKPDKPLYGGWDG